MNDSVDYSAIIADMEAKRDALNASIESLRALVGVWQGTPAAKPAQRASAASPRTGAQPYQGKTVIEAVRMFLSDGSRRPVSEISDALENGGVASRSTNFRSIVQNVLNRLKEMGEIARFPEGWGLTKGSRKAAAAPVVQKRGRKPGKTNAKKAPAGKGGSGIQEKIEKALASGPVVPGDLADSLGVRVQTVSLVLGKLMRAGKVKKSADGKVTAI
ncbi:MAG: helix-turn-helix domain-containing protein [Bryobacteraceae bacterium]|nr:helix-turn-helix domain-containing protein [Bryobacteraceae bacterium]